MQGSYTGRCVIPPDFYAWHREEIQYWQARTARVCAHLLHQSGAFPLAEAAIADVGCGEGRWLLEFLQWGAVASNLHGIDLLDERIAYGRERLPGADLRSGDAAKLENELGWRATETFETGLAKTVQCNYQRPHT